MPAGRRPRRYVMTGWIVAATTTAVLGAGFGAAWAPTSSGPTSWTHDTQQEKEKEKEKDTSKWTNNLKNEQSNKDLIADQNEWDHFAEDMRWAWAPDQAVRIFSGSGSQLGVSIRDLNDEDLKGSKNVTTGVVIESVETDSPAQKAGFKNGDVVVEFDGERVRGTRQFTRLVQETPAGRQIQAVVIRDGQRSTLSVQPRIGGDFRY